MKEQPTIVDAVRAGLEQGVLRLKTSHEHRAAHLAATADELELRLVQRSILRRISICALVMVIVNAIVLAGLDPPTALAFVVTILGTGIFCAWPARQWYRNAPKRAALAQRWRDEARKLDALERGGGGR